MENITLTTIVISQVITFLVLVLLLRRIMYSAYAAELKRLRDLSLENQNKAEKLARDMEKAEHEHQLRVEKAEAELRQLRNSTQADAKEQREELLRKAREEGDRIVQQAMSVRDRIRHELEAQVGERSITIACTLIRDVLTAENMKWFHEGLVKDVLAAMGRIDEGKLRSLKTDRPVEVKTPYELPQAKLEELAQILGRGHDQTIKVKQVVDREVIAGLVVCSGSLMIDGSLAGQLRRVSQKSPGNG